MKVAIFIHALDAGGAQRVASVLANHWAHLGWQVGVITLASADRDAYCLSASILRTALNLTSENASLVGGVIGNIRRIRGLRRALERLRPDIVVSMTSTCNVLLALAGIGLGQGLQIGSERTHPPRASLGSIWKWLRARTYGLLDATVVLTQETADWVRTHTAARRIAVIPNPVTWPLVSREPIREPAGIGSAARKRLLTVGRLSPEKRYDWLIEVFERLARRFPDWELVIVGDGPERDRLDAKIGAMDLRDVVLLPGEVGNVGDWYERAQLYVLTSRFEGFPNALAEAMAYGLPAVSVDCDTGPRDIIRHQVDGLLVPPSDDRALERALAELMEDATKRAALGSRAREVRTRFAIERVHDLWSQLFSELGQQSGTTTEAHLRSDWPHDIGRD